LNVYVVDRLGFLVGTGWLSAKNETIARDTANVKVYEFTNLRVVAKVFEEMVKESREVVWVYINVRGNCS
jgi:cytochrome b